MTRTATKADTAILARAVAAANAKLRPSADDEMPRDGRRATLATAVDTTNSRRAKSF